MPDLRISVVLRTRDRIPLLLEALDSLRAQTRPAEEIIVVNAGGEDPRPHLTGAMADLPLHVVDTDAPHIRPRAANRGWRAATGTHIVFLDDDDLLHPNHLALLAAASARDPQTLPYTGYEILRLQEGEDGAWSEIHREAVRPAFDGDRLWFENFIAFMTMLFPRAALEAVGGLDDTLEIFEDWDLLLRLRAEYDFALVSEASAVYRVFLRGEKSATLFERPAAWMARLFEKHRATIPGTAWAAYYRGHLVKNMESLSLELHTARTEAAEERARADALERELHLARQPSASDREASEARREAEEARTRAEVLDSTLREIYASRAWRWLSAYRQWKYGWRDRMLHPLRILWSHGPAYALRRWSARAAWRHAYSLWIARHDPTPEELDRQREAQRAFADRPLVSVIVPVYNVKPAWLHACLQSVLEQTYDHWELLVVDDCSTNTETRAALEAWGRVEGVRLLRSPENGGISAASNLGLREAKGEWIALLDHDDTLSPEALFRNVEAIQNAPDLDYLYSDEDKIDPNGRRCDPFFKPDWSPETFLNSNYLCHFSVIRTALAREAGGFRSPFDGCQDYDFLLRVTERAQRIAHLPRILYHWRIIPGSTAGAYLAKGGRIVTRTREALREAAERRGWEAEVTGGLDISLQRVRFHVDPARKVSILVPTRDRGGILRVCLESLRRYTTHPAYEIVVIDNDSTDAETLAYLEALAEDPRVRVLRHPGPFNHSAMNNVAVEACDGEFVLLLNNDVEATHAGWLTAMLEHAQRPEVGIVGAKLLYPDGRIQHGGIVLGIQGVASASHRYAPGDSPGYFRALQSVRNYSAVTCACALLRRAVYREVGGFDAEALPASFNDVDLCLRIREAGYRVVWTPYAELVHHESYSRPKFPEPESILTMRERWGRALDNDPFYNPHLTMQREDWTLALDEPRPFRPE